MEALFTPELTAMLIKALLGAFALAVVVAGAMAAADRGFKAAIRRLFR